MTMSYSAYIKLFGPSSVNCIYKEASPNKPWSFRTVLSVKP